MGLLAKPRTLSTNRGTAAGYNGQWQATRVVSTAWVDWTALIHTLLSSKTVQPTPTLGSTAPWNRPIHSLPQLHLPQRFPCSARRAVPSPEYTLCTWHPAQKLSRMTSPSTSSGDTCFTPSGDCPTSHIPTLIKALI